VHQAATAWQPVSGSCCVAEPGNLLSHFCARMASQIHSCVRSSTLSLPQLSYAPTPTHTFFMHLHQGRS
jgi:hypothetical protein